MNAGNLLLTLPKVPSAMSLRTVYSPILEAGNTSGTSGSDSLMVLVEDVSVDNTISKRPWLAGLCVVMFVVILRHTSDFDIAG